MGFCPPRPVPTQRSGSPEPRSPRQDLTPAQPSVRGTDLSLSPGLRSGRHSSSLWFYIKQTLPASSPAGPGNRAADLGHLGTVPPLYLDFRAKFSICEILWKLGEGATGRLERYRHVTAASPASSSPSPSQPPNVPPRLPLTLRPTKRFGSGQNLPPAPNASLSACCGRRRQRGGTLLPAQPGCRPRPTRRGAAHRALFSSSRSGRGERIL